MSVLESLEVRSAIRSLRDVIPGEELNALEPTGPGAVYYDSCHGVDDDSATAWWRTVVAGRCEKCDFARRRSFS